MQSSQVGSAKSSAPRPRLLALHGWRTSASVLSQQLQRAGLDGVLGRDAELVFLDGPHPARGPPTSDVARAFQPPFFEWWDAVQDGGPGAGPGAAAMRYVGAEATLARLGGELRTSVAAGQPVVGLVGFSQGAILASLVVAMQERGVAFQDVPPLRCAVLIAGGAARDPAFADLYGGTTAAAAAAAGQGPDAAAATAAGGAASARSGAGPSPLPPLALPSCHILGSGDPLKSSSERLLAAFRKPLVLRHEQGHVVPCLGPEQQRQLQDFLAVHLTAMPTATAGTPTSSGDRLAPPPTPLMRGSL